MCFYYKMQPPDLISATVMDSQIYLSSSFSSVLTNRQLTWYSFETSTSDPQLLVVPHHLIILPTMHRSNIALRHPKMQLIGPASQNPLERLVVVHSDPTCLLEHGHPTCPSTLDIELHRGEGSDVGNCFDSGAIHFDATDSALSNDGVSDIPEQTRATTFDDNADVHGGPTHDLMLRCDKQGQDLYNYHPREKSFVGPANMASNIYVNVQSCTDGEVVDPVSGFTEAGADKDQLAIKLEQSVGSGRHYHHPGTSDETLGPNSAEATEPQPNKDQISNGVFTPWTSPWESTTGARKLIRRAREMGVLQDATFANHSQSVDSLQHGTKLVATYESCLAAMRTPRFTSPMDEVRPATRFSTSEDKISPIEARRKASSSSSAARQIRIHESPPGVVPRMMPLDRTISFDVDKESFRRAAVQSSDIDRLIKAACSVAKVFGARNLGITFAHAPGPGPKVFSIRYDPTLSSAVAADSFFPCDPREDWQVRISPAAFLAWDISGDPWYMIRALAHEFMHILGFRHHHAGSKEVQLSSVHWPGTVDGDTHSIMYTSVHHQLWFSEEDFRVIQELYSKPNRALVSGRWVIRDVDPYDGRHVL